MLVGIRENTKLCKSPCAAAVLINLLKMFVNSAMYLISDFNASLELPGGFEYRESDGAVEVCIVLSPQPTGATSVGFSIVVIEGEARIPSGSFEWHQLTYAINLSVYPANRY